MTRKLCPFKAAVDSSFAGTSGVSQDIITQISNLSVSQWSYDYVDGK